MSTGRPSATRSSPPSSLISLPAPPSLRRLGLPSQGRCLLPWPPPLWRPLRELRLWARAQAWSRRELLEIGL
ncbi:hypothetical protein TB2_030908 [Malus domestica]